MFSQVFASTAVGLICLTPLTSGADPTEEVAKMVRTFHAATTFHSEMDSGRGEKLIVDFVAPDRFHVVLPDGTESILVGHVYWMKLNGKYVKAAGSAASLKNLFEMTSTLGSLSGDLAKDYDISDAGASLLNGVAANTYMIVKHGQNIPIKLWIGADSLPLQQFITAKEGSMTVRYSRFNAPQTIDVP